MMVTKSRLFHGIAASALIVGGFAIVAANTPANTAVAKTSKAKPQLGSFGFDTAGMDKATKPGDDFYKFANGGWQAATMIPAVVIESVRCRSKKIGA